MNRHLIGAVFLVAGTCIGAGMLALPVATSEAGFFLSVFLLIAVWLLMSFTGLLVVEANLRLPEGTSFISMSEQTLGRVGKIVTWFCFILLLYSLLAAYFAGGGAVIHAVEELYLRRPVQSWMAYVPWLIIFSVIIYYGIAVTDLLNRLLVLGLVGTFIALVLTTASHVQLHLLKGFHSKYVLATLPILFASFGYHVILPSLRTYLCSHVRHLKIAVIGGGAVALVMYLVWNLVVFGLIPTTGSHGLIAILHAGYPTSQIINALSTFTHNFWIVSIARFFIFFAIASSFLGVSLGLFDLLADGFKIKKDARGRGILAALTFIPPFVFALFFPTGFVLALSYAGVLVAILHGILPALMVWSGRYSQQLKSTYVVWGGRGSLIVVMLCSLAVIFAQLHG